MHQPLEQLQDAIYQDPKCRQLSKPGHSQQSNFTANKNGLILRMVYLAITEPIYIPAVLH